MGTIYQQIADRIRDDIVQGVLRPDQQVMSTNQYAAMYGVDPGTVSRGYRQLVEEGLLYRRAGVGMFVSPDGWTRLRGLRQKAVTLGITLDEILARVSRLKGNEAGS